MGLFQKKGRSHHRPRTRVERRNLRARSQDQEAQPAGAVRPGAALALHRLSLRAPAPGKPPPPRPPTASRFSRRSSRIDPAAPTAAATPQHFNELGVRKFDLLAVWERLKKQFAARPLANPKLINYLAAGSIQGLRPLRYEKRIARKRFFFLFAVVLLFCYGIVYWVTHRH